MSECMIFRILDANQGTVEVAYKDSKGNMNFKTINFEQFAETVKSMSNAHDCSKKIKLCTEEIIGYGNNCVLIKQEARKRVVMLNLYNQEAKAYKISFPNALYIVHYNNFAVSTIELYAYKKYLGKDTKLFEYPMPNEVTGNKLCIGSAPREIYKGDIVKALETILFIPYSHKTFSGVRGFSDSEKWFEYLSTNEFPYKLLIPLNRKLEEVLD